MQIISFPHYLIIFTIIFVSVTFPQRAQANEIPRYVSLSSDKVFMRVGPGKQYPIKWEYRASGYPVEVVREFEHWRKIRDMDGYEGWVYKGLLSGKRTGLVISETQNKDIWLRRSNNDDAQKIARVEPRAILHLNECSPIWCKASAQGITGWIKRKYLWGIYASEIIE